LDAAKGNRKDSDEHLRTMVKAILRKQRQAPEKKSWGIANIWLSFCAEPPCAERRARGRKRREKSFRFFLSAAFLIQPFTDRITNYNGNAIAEKAMIKASKHQNLYPL